MAIPKKRQFPTTKQFEQAARLLKSNKSQYLCRTQTGLSHDFVYVAHKLYGLANPSQAGKTDNAAGKGGLNTVTFCADQDGHIFIHKSRIKSAKTASASNVSTANRNLALKKLGRFIAEGVHKQGTSLILKYVPGISLDQYLKQFHAPYEFDRLALELLWAIKRLHRLKIIHGDIKPNNVIVSDKITAIDFDGCTHFDDGNLNQKPQRWYGARYYAAPEVLQHKFIHPLSDAYSSGTSLRVMMDICLKQASPYGLTSLYYWLWPKLKPHFYQRLSLKMRRTKLSERLSIEKAINWVVRHQDGQKWVKHLKLAAISGITLSLSVLYVAASLPIWQQVLMVGCASFVISGFTSLCLQARQWWMKRCFEQLAPDPIACLNKLDSLSPQQRYPIAFGYKAGAHQQLLSWLYPSTYQKGYYAGLRLQEMAPNQDLFLEERSVIAYSKR